MVQHLRIHRANDVTWCGRRITWKRTTPMTNVETISAEAHSLTRVRYVNVRYVNGQIDYSPLTPEQKQVIATELARLQATVTCKRCRKSMGWE